MCMMLNIPPAIEAGVVDYEKSSGKTVEQVVIDYLTKEFAEQKNAKFLLTALRKWSSVKHPLRASRTSFGERMPTTRSLPDAGIP